MASSVPSQWFCFQIGAREHYAVPRALLSVGSLGCLYTDAWMSPTSMLTRVGLFKRLSGRYHPELFSACVHAPLFASFIFELRCRLLGPRVGWPRTIARNTWFQRWARAQLRSVSPESCFLFSYSYAARSLFQVASQRGWTCVLGQMDPGPEEEQLVLAEHRRYPNLTSSWKPVPDLYWQHWHDELALAQRILVNSNWSRRCLLQQGVPEHKLRLVPLVYAPSGADLRPRASRPALAPSPPRDSPFQLLFLGTIGLRKGLARLLDAMALLHGQPVQLTLAGPTELDPEAWADSPNVRWIGPVPRSQVPHLYAQADAMILPTLSDGFALTQLEALAYGCPVIASEFCGEVVTSGVNGWLLPSLEPEQIASTILEAMETAQSLPRPLHRPGFGLSDLAAALNAC